MIPGKPAPKLITEKMVKTMKTGSVIIDLAAAGGGNCELTVAGKVVSENGVKIIGYTDLVSRLPNQSSQLYANNLVNLMKLLVSDQPGNVLIDTEDVVIRNMVVVKDGEIMFPPPPIQVSAAPVKKVEPTNNNTANATAEVETSNSKAKPIAMLIAASAFAWIASVAPSDFLSHFTVFVLSCVIGYYVVWNVTHALHTPLMSVTNAISGIIVVGALLQIGSESLLVQFLAFIAILIASINIFGGFLVTKRMLKMFKK